MKLRHRLCLSLAALPFLAPAASSQCAEWSPDFSSPGIDGPVHAHAVIQWAGTDQLLVGGDFDWVGDVNVDQLALYDGTTWSAFAAGVPGSVMALAQYDDGSGLKIYAGGDGFLSSWDGSTWSTMTVVGDVRAMHVHDDGNGAALFVGGAFTSIDGTSLADIGRYDGSWDNLNGGTVHPAGVLAFETHDAGSGTALYVAGRFSEIGGVAIDDLACWDGSVFTEVGGGVDGGNYHNVRAVKSYTPPGGVAELHVGGNFTSAGGAATSKWVAWRQGNWVDIGGDEIVDAFTLRVSGSGLTICAARQNTVETYDGVTRTQQPVLQPSVLTDVFAFGVSATEQLFVSTLEFNESGSHVGHRSANAWGPLFAGPGEALGLPNYVTNLVSHDLGAGPRLLAFTPQSEFFGSPIGVFDGSSWGPLNTNNFGGGGIDHAIGPNGHLYISGKHSFPGLPGNYLVSRLNGNTWEPVGSTHSGGGMRDENIEFFDAGSGPELYVGAHLAGDINGPGTAGVARLSNDQWVSVGGSITLSPANSIAVTVYSLKAWNDGTGNGLYVGGCYREAGGVASNNIARWDGSNWSALGDGIQSTLGVSATVFEMEVFDGPQGEQLIVGGVFNRAGTTNANSIAAWDGSAWAPLGTGLKNPNGGYGLVHKMISHDPDGQGERLYVFGSFNDAGGVAVENVAIWDGASWSSADGFPAGYQVTLQTHDDGSGRALYLAGFFTEAGGLPSKNIAKYQDPCGDLLGTPACTSEPNSTGLVGLTRASGSASLTDEDLTVIARRLPANAFTLFFAGTGLQRGVAGDGVLCVAGSLMRMNPGGFADAGGVAMKSFDFQANYASNAIAGQTLVIQGFFRDAAGGPAGFNTTDAIEILMEP